MLRGADGAAVNHLTQPRKCHEKEDIERHLGGQWGCISELKVILQAFE
jgi:hypothetical protein